MADLSRRSVLPAAATAVAAALASAAALPAVAAQASTELAQLIEAHRGAFDAFDRMTKLEDETDTAFRKAEREREPAAIPCFDSTIPFTGGIVSFEDCRNAIENSYDFFTGTISRMRSRNPVKAGEMLAEYKLTKDANLDALDAAVKDYEQRQEAAGVTALRRARLAACEAEETTLIAICAYVPHLPEEGRAKAEYLATIHTRTKGYDWDERHVEALLESIAGGQLYDD